MKGREGPDSWSWWFLQEKNCTLKEKAGAFKEALQTSAKRKDSLNCTVPYQQILKGATLSTKMPLLPGLSA